MQRDSIFLEFTVSMLNSNAHTSRSVLEKILGNWEASYQIHGKILEKGPGYCLRFEFQDSKEINYVYSRNRPYFEKIIEWRNQNQFTNLQFSLGLTNIERDSDVPIFLVLKVTSNYLAPIKENYDFTFKFAKFFDMRVSYEEINDGFLIFYETAQMFDFMQIDHINKEEMFEWLEKNQALTESNKVAMELFFQSFA